MNKRKKVVMRKVVKTVLVVFIFLSSGLALLFQLLGQFDPVRMATKLKSEDKRDQALDVIEFSRKNNIGDQEKLKKLHNKYQHGAAGKTKRVFWDGAVKGEVSGMYSGMGCVAADLMIIGDVRDLAKEGVNAVSGKDVDHVVAGLSAVGVGTTAAEVTGVGVVADAGVSVVKTAAKYASKVLKQIPDSILKAASSGKKLSKKGYKKIWLLFKHSEFSIPYTATTLSKFKKVKHLDGMVALTKRLKGGSIILVRKTGKAGARTYESFRKLKLGGLFTTYFKRHPKAALGITKVHSVLHVSKIIKKLGFITPLVIISSFLAIILSIFPFWISFAIFLASGGYVTWNVRQFIIKRRRAHNERNTELQQDGTMKNS